jgi:hypothetical protein
MGDITIMERKQKEMLTIEQLEEEISANSEVGRKLKSVEKELDKY